MSNNQDHPNDKDNQQLNELQSLLEVCEKQPASSVLAGELLSSISRGENPDYKKIWELTETLQAQMNPQELWLNLNISTSLLKLIFNRIDEPRERIKFLEKLTQFQIITNHEVEAQESLKSLLSLIEDNDEARSALLTLGMLYIEVGKIENAGRLFFKLVDEYKDVIAGSFALAVFFSIKPDQSRFTEYNTTVARFAPETARRLAEIVASGAVPQYHQIVQLLGSFDRELDDYSRPAQDSDNPLY